MNYSRNYSRSFSFKNSSHNGSLRRLLKTTLVITVLFKMMMTAEISEAQISNDHVLTSTTQVNVDLNMSKFKTVLNGTQIYLMWTSVNEQEDCIYVIERSKDEVNYEHQTVMNGVAGNFELFYSWIDESPGQGNNYYRIEKVTASGEHYFSIINTVFYANPVSGQTATTVE